MKSQMKELFNLFLTARTQSKLQVNYLQRVLTPSTTDNTKGFTVKHLKTDVHCLWSLVKIKICFGLLVKVTLVKMLSKVNRRDETFSAALTLVPRFQHVNLRLGMAVQVRLSYALVVAETTLEFPDTYKQDWPSMNLGKIRFISTTTTKQRT